MSSRASATRYARALFDVSVKESDPVQTEQELTAVSTLIDGHAELRSALRSPGVPPATKKAIVEALAVRAAVSAPMGKLLALLAERDRLVLLPDLLDAFRARLMEQQRVITAEVTTALPLAAEQHDGLQRRLSAATAKQVMLTAKVDPAVIGGAVTRIGSTVYDGSLATQLSKLKARLVEHR